MYDIASNKEKKMCLNIWWKR